MKMNKIIAALLAAILLMVGNALAAESMDANSAVRLTLVFQNNGKGLDDAQFAIYRIASVDQTGKLTPLPPYNRYNVQINGRSESDMAGVASTLEGYILRDDLEPTASGSTDHTGSVSFSENNGNIQSGLYLILGSRYVADGTHYTLQPSIVQLPAWNEVDEVWDYDVVINAKYEAEPDFPDYNTVTRKVLTVWENTENGIELPQKVVVHLLKDGEVYDTVALSADHLWRHSWQELDANHHWTVVEEELEDYSVIVTREGVTFVVTNTYDPEEPVPTPTPKPTPPPNDTPDTPKLPQTGQLWWPVPMLISLGLLLTVIGLLRRRGR